MSLAVTIEVVDGGAVDIVKLYTYMWTVLVITEVFIRHPQIGCGERSQPITSGLDHRQASLIRLHGYGHHVEQIH